MSDEITLELEVDLPLEPEDIDLYHSYIASGVPEGEAAVRVAQNILGSSGAVVQHAEAVLS